MIKVEGIILREARYGETGKILTVFTKELGKINIMVKGVYKPKSRLIANTQMFSLNSFTLKKGKNFYYIVDADLIESFYKIREDIEKIVFGYYVLELVDKSMAGEMPSGKVYELLKKGLYVLSQWERDFFKFIIAFEIKYISFLGYRPNLETCVNCGCKTSHKNNFSIEYGGIVCENCKNIDRYSSNFNDELCGIMIKAMYLPFEKLEDINDEKEKIVRVHNILVDYILYNIDRKKFNSLLFLETIV